MSVTVRVWQSQAADGAIQGQFRTPRDETAQSAYACISAQSGELRAIEYVDTIVRRCRSLALFPERGAKRDDIRPRLRTIGHARSATIAFAVDQARTEVTILGVFYGGQDFEASIDDQDA